MIQQHNTTIVLDKSTLRVYEVFGRVKIISYPHNFRSQFRTIAICDLKLPLQCSRNGNHKYRRIIVSPSTTTPCIISCNQLLCLRLQEESIGCFDPNPARIIGLSYDLECFRYTRCARNSYYIFSIALNINPHKLFAVDPEIKCGLIDPPQLQQYI